MSGPWLMTEQKIQALRAMASQTASPREADIAREKLTILESSTSAYNLWLDAYMNYYKMTINYILAPFYSLIDKEKDD